VKEEARRRIRSNFGNAAEIARRPDNDAEGRFSAACYYARSFGRTAVVFRMVIFSLV
jgi:hypothetical protein